MLAGMQIRVREAEADDLPAVLALMRELARHEGLSSYFQLTHEALAECCLRSPKRFHVLVAASDTAILGYAVYLFQFSPWAAREYLFLDDLYVDENARGAGVGRRLMRRVAEIALERGVDARWHVETVNRPAQRFYGALGADLRDRLIAYWSQEAMRALL